MVRAMLVAEVAAAKLAALVVARETLGLASKPFLDRCCCGWQCLLIRP